MFHHPNRKPHPHEQPPPSLLQPWQRRPTLHVRKLRVEGATSRMDAASHWARARKPAGWPGPRGSSLPVAVEQLPGEPHHCSHLGPSAPVPPRGDSEWPRWTRRPGQHSTRCPCEGPEAARALGCVGRTFSVPSACRPCAGLRDAEGRGATAVPVLLGFVPRGQRKSEQMVKGAGRVAPE